jgi:2-dehydro-3-deoxygalactonokinase
MTQAGSPMPAAQLAGAVDAASVTDAALDASGAATAQTQAVSLDQAALVALDWGTTSLRAYLFDAAGNVLDTRESTAGIMNLPRPAAANR